MPKTQLDKKSKSIRLRIRVPKTQGLTALTPIRPVVISVKSKSKAKKVRSNIRTAFYPLLGIIFLTIVGLFAFWSLFVGTPFSFMAGGNSSNLESVSPTTPVASESISPVLPVAPSLPAESGVSAEVPKVAQQLNLIPNRLGYLNVRAGPGTNYKLLRQINDQGTFEYTTTEVGWYRIILEDGAPGWIYGDYAEVIK